MIERSNETETQKRIRRTQEATVYRVQEDFGRGSGVYRIAKRTIDVEVEVYHVQIGKDTVWCDCPGFRRQKFDVEQHKHIRAARDYISRGSPEYIDYRFLGAGKNTQIKFVRSKE